MCLNIIDFFIIRNCVIDLGISWYFFSCSVKCQIFISSNNCFVTGKLHQLKLYILHVKFISKFHLYFGKKRHPSQPSRLNICDLEGLFFETYNESRVPLLSPT